MFRIKIGRIKGEWYATITFQDGVELSFFNRRKFLAFCDVIDNFQRGGVA